MDIMKKRWLVLAASALITLCIGSLYAWSAFASPMGIYLSECSGREITNLAIVFTIANAVGPITMISGGALNEKLGPRKIVLIGGLLFGAGMICSGFAQTLGVLILTYGLGVGLGVGMIYGVTVSNTVKFFPDKGGMAGGVITACYGASSIIVPPIANALAEAYHVTTAFRLIGIAMMIIICVCAVVVTPCPREFQLPGTAGKAQAVQTREYTCGEMLREKDFYLMFLALMCGAFAGMMVISQASQIAQRMMGMTAAAAAVVVSVIALFNTLGRLLSGSISDKIGATGVMKITFTVSVVVSILLFALGERSAILFYACLALIGFSFGSIMGIYPAFTARRFGRKNSSVNYGVMFIGFAVAGVIGPMIIASIYGATDRYQPAFLVSAGLAAAGVVLTLVLDRKQKQVA